MPKQPTPPVDRPAPPRILAAALAAFAERGYHGTSIRDIAAGAGLSVPGVYHHYRSKQEVLGALVVAIMSDLLARSRTAVAGVEEPSARFDVLVEELLRFHMERREDAFVASSEIRSLEPDLRERYVALRDEQQAMILDAVEAGVASGAFATAYPVEAARSVAVLCVGVATWYRADGPSSPDDLVARHLRLARALVEAR